MLSIVATYLTRPVPIFLFFLEYVLSQYSSLNLEITYFKFQLYFFYNH